jgi:hypothetical protein
MEIQAHSNANMKAIKTMETNIVVFIEADELSWWKSMYLAGEAPKASDNRATASSSGW